MDKQAALTEAVKQAAVERDGRMTLACADAFSLTRKLGANLSDISTICNTEKIKIVQCQLGCFK